MIHKGAYILEEAYLEKAKLTPSTFLKSTQKRKTTREEKECLISQKKIAAAFSEGKKKTFRGNKSSTSKKELAQKVLAGRVL